jgi:hypothetical protein
MRNFTNQALAKTFLVLSVLALAQCHVYYPTTDYATGESFTLTQSDIYKICSCDKTPGICDPMCCCDTKCSEQLSLGQTDWNYTCKNSADSATVFCYEDKHIYTINAKRGLKKTTSQNTGQLCVQGSGTSLGTYNFFPKNRFQLCGNKNSDFHREDHVPSLGIRNFQRLPHNTKHYHQSQHLVLPTVRHDEL